MNKYGLRRDIPSDVKRKVRQRDGFGCVVCGKGIVEYEHVKPAFKDASFHNADGITLLCPTCHAKVTRGILSKDQIKSAMLNPMCKQLGHVKEVFGLTGIPALRFGGVLLKCCPTPIEVCGRPLFSVKPPEQPGAPFRLSGIFTDSEGNISLVIDDNEWKASTNTWDVEVVGPKIIIREAQREISLVLRVESSESPGLLIVERLNMRLEGYSFEANGDSLVVKDGAKFLDLSGCVSDNCDVGLFFDQDGSWGIGRKKPL